MSCWLSDEDLQELRAVASTTSRCCDGLKRCRRCQMLDQVELVCAELEQRRWDMPVIHTHEACTEQTCELVAAVGAVDVALGRHTPLTAAGHAALSRLREAADDVLRWVLKPVASLPPPAH